jgi:hypoxanthine phosphoribosyltransferase
MSAEKFSTLIDRHAIARRVRELGAEITRDLQGGITPCLIPVMDGGMIFAADLMREIPLQVLLRPVKASSYGAGTSSRGKVTLPWGLPEDVKGSTVLLIDDILDTGLTFGVLRTRILEAGASVVRTCVLLRKKSAAHLAADYIGFDIPDHFVIGYGLDLAGLYRNLPDIMYQPTES